MHESFGDFSVEVNSCRLHSQFQNSSVEEKTFQLNVMNVEVAECSVQDTPFLCMRNVRRFSLEVNTFYSLTECGVFHIGSSISEVC